MMTILLLERGKKSKRQRISSCGLSGPADQPLDDGELFENDVGDVNTDQKLSLILSKLSVNESRVGSMQSKLNAMMDIRSRVALSENVVRSQHVRLKLLEYRSIDLEARSRRKKN